MNDIKQFHKLFYLSKKKNDQDKFILYYCKALVTKRRRIRNEVATKPKSITVEYHVKKIDGTEIKVCRDSFLGILNVKKDRILRLLKKFKESGQLPQETRGGDRVKDKNTEKKNTIKAFIESLKCTESHYCRSDSPYRIYLPCDLNIKKLFQMYNNQAPQNLKVKECFFRNYFNKHYNVGFGTPQTDLCSMCLQYKEKIKKSRDPTTIRSLVTNYKVHKLQAKSFFNFLKENDPSVVIFSFDCQKNLQIPKLPDQQAYFSMQVNFYNFGVVIGNSKASLSAENVRCYVWTELERPKGSNEIASAIFHTLNNYEFNLQQKTVRLVCDGCGGQNKNSIFIGMLCFWFATLAPEHIQQVEVIFPIVGHSFIPPDRVFGNIEKEIRRISEITSPEAYENIIKKRAKVLKLGQHDYKVLDWKSETQKILKSTAQWHFKFKPSKRFIMTKNKSGMVLMRGEPVYRSNVGEAKGIYRKGKKIEAMKPKEIPIGVKIKEDKIKSISNLLKSHYGAEWVSDENLRYLQEVLKKDYANAEEVDEAVEDDNDDEVTV